MSKFPFQPIIKDNNGVKRFEKNALVRHLLDSGNIKINDLAKKFDFTEFKEDWKQFAQLLGYSIEGFLSLDYCNDVDEKILQVDLNEINDSRDLQIKMQEFKLEQIKREIRILCIKVFGEDPGNN